MTLISMTGFARQDGAGGDFRWSWEVKTVNAKGLDVRLRLPQGFDELEPAIRSAVAGRFVRGSCQIALAIRREQKAAGIRVNHELLAAVLAAMKDAATHLDVAPPRLDGLFSIKGVLDLQDMDEAVDLPALQPALLADLQTAIAGCGAMRRSEGQALATVLAERLAEIESLTREADDNPARTPDKIRAKLADQIRQILDSAPTLDADRLYQEAVLLATKADIREELDRLRAHIAAARDLMQAGEAVGRKLDFLAQEFNREANTLCSKSNDVSLTATGLKLKAAVE